MIKQVIVLIRVMFFTSYNSGIQHAGTSIVRDVIEVVQHFTMVKMILSCMPDNLNLYNMVEQIN